MTDHDPVVLTGPGTVLRPMPDPETIRQLREDVARLRAALDRCACRHTLTSGPGVHRPDTLASCAARDELDKTRIAPYPRRPGAKDR